MVSEGLCQVFWVFYLVVISKDTFYFMWFAVGLACVTSVFAYWLPESPRYLYGINNLDKCRDTLAYIARMNGVQNYEPAKFEADYEIAVDDVDEIAGASRQSPRGTAK